MTESNKTNTPKRQLYKKAQLNAKHLFQSGRKTGLGLRRRRIDCLAQFLVLKLLDIGEKDEEDKFHPASCSLAHRRPETSAANIPLLGHHQ